MALGVRRASSSQGGAKETRGRGSRNFSKKRPEKGKGVVASSKIDVGLEGDHFSFEGTRPLKSCKGGILHALSVGKRGKGYLTKK